MANEVERIQAEPELQKALYRQESEAATLMQIISRAATDPACDIEKMERLWAMHERMQSTQAEVAFASAFADMQTALPSIGERGSVTGRYTYALWEDINAAIKPVLSAHGFALSFRINTDNGVRVTGVLCHKAGHSIETTITLPVDASGNKPAVQAVASATSYGKRYTAGALLNLTSHGEDDDAFRAATDVLSDEQQATISDMLEATGSKVEAFCGIFRVKRVCDIPEREYQRAMDLLAKKAAKVKS